MANTSFVFFAESGAPAGTEGSAGTLQPSDAGAGQQAPPPSNTMMMIPFIILIAVMIAISVRTSSKEKKKREEMMNSIRKGTKIMTSGGILGEIAEVQKDQFLLKVANNVQIAISRSAVAQVIQPAAEAADTKAEVTKK